MVSGAVSGRTLAEVRRGEPFDDGGAVNKSSWEGDLLGESCSRLVTLRRVYGSEGVSGSPDGLVPRRGSPPILVEEIP